jgi:translocation and assembly module TamA
VFAQEQQDEDTYTLNLTRVLPRVEWTPRENVSVYGFYRAELDLLDRGSVPDAVRAALPGAAPSTSWISSLALGVDWNHTDDLLDPTRGWTTSTVIEPVGLGGDWSFLRLIADVRGYAPVGLGVVVATRLRLGTEQPWGGNDVVPLWERLYAGGVNSVRGYARRRVGPLADDEPLGGQSVVETSFELRRHIWDKVGGAVFLDAGQAALDPWTFPIDDMQKGVGFGLRYLSPVSPIRVDLGFPLDRRGDDASWQVYLSVGETF